MLAALFQAGPASAQFFPAAPPSAQFPNWRIELPYTRPVRNMTFTPTYGYGAGGGGGGTWIRGKPLLPMAPAGSPIHHWSPDQLMQGEALRQADQVERDRQAQILRRQEQARLQQAVAEQREKFAQDRADSQDREARRLDSVAQQCHRRALEELARQETLFSPMPLPTFDPATAPPPKPSPAKPNEPAEDAERRAAAKLKLGQQLVTLGQARDGREYFESVVASYPHTQAAEQARELLAKKP
jgi:hypothetical protein